MPHALFPPTAFGVPQPLPVDAIHHAFERHARLQPNAPAVQHLGKSISYADLDTAANRLAHTLRRRGVLPGARVCLLVQRSIAMVIGIVAILKAGGAYVPMDGGIVTDSSLEHVIADSRAVLTLADREFLHRVEAHPSLCLQDIISQGAADQADSSKPADLSSPRDGVYVIYTSGTTGKPKGVDVMHRNVVNLLCLSPGNVGMKPGLRVAQLLNIAFDMCAWEVLGALANGCTLCLRGKSSAEWKAVLKAVDVVIATPSVLGLHDPADYPNIKFAATAGEVCPQGLADKWSKSSQFFNSCGPTEITIVNTVQPHSTGAPLSIGTPTPNNNVYILDEQMRPVAVGEQGLMWAGGAGVTRGYLNLPDKTAERYRLDPFAADGSMMFNTGDIGRWRADGQIEHLGRADDQVKVKGFRVELDGVAAAMETCSGVAVATALLVGKELWGFYTPATATEAEVKAATAKIQPYYAVPGKYVALEEFPHTSNGKIDKRALRAMAQQKTASAAPSKPAAPTAETSATAAAAAAAAVATAAATAVVAPTVSKPSAAVPQECADAATPAPAPVEACAVKAPQVNGHAAPRPTARRNTVNGEATAFRYNLKGESGAFRADLTAAALPLDMAVAAAACEHSISLQNCLCEPGLAHEPIHLVPVPIRVPRREQRSTRVEVVTINPATKNAANLASHYSTYGGFTWSRPGWEVASVTDALRYGPFTRKATCALLVVGREVLSSAPGSVISKCAACNGWSHATSGCPSADKDHNIAKEKVAEIACSLTQQAGVEVVCILSDPKTSHALVNELGHRGVPVAVGVMG